MLSLNGNRAKDSISTWRNNILCFKNKQKIRDIQVFKVRENSCS